MSALERTRAIAYGLNPKEGPKDSAAATEVKTPALTSASTPPPAPTGWKQLKALDSTKEDIALKQAAADAASSILAAADRAKAMNAGTKKPAPTAAQTSTPAPKQMGPPTPSPPPPFFFDGYPSGKSNASEGDGHSHQEDGTSTPSTLPYSGSSIGEEEGRKGPVETCARLSHGLRGCGEAGDIRVHELNVVLLVDGPHGKG
jgi:hypothetical protein